MSGWQGIWAQNATSVTFVWRQSKQAEHTFRELGDNSTFCSVLSEAIGGIYWEEKVYILNNQGCACCEVAPRVPQCGRWWQSGLVYFLWGSDLCTGASAWLAASLGPPQTTPFPSYNSWSVADLVKCPASGDAYPPLLLLQLHVHSSTHAHTHTPLRHPSSIRWFIPLHTPSKCAPGFLAVICVNCCTKNL